MTTTGWLPEPNPPWFCPAGRRSRWSGRRSHPASGRAELRADCSPSPTRPARWPWYTTVDWPRVTPAVASGSCAGGQEYVPLHDERLEHLTNAEPRSSGTTSGSPRRGPARSRCPDGADLLRGCTGGSLRSWRLRLRILGEDGSPPSEALNNFFRRRVLNIHKAETSTSAFRISPVRATFNGQPRTRSIGGGPTHGRENGCLPRSRACLPARREPESHWEARLFEGAVPFQNPPPRTQARSVRCDRCSRRSVSPAHSTRHPGSASPAATGSRSERRSLAGCPREKSFIAQHHRSSQVARSEWLGAGANSLEPPGSTGSRPDGLKCQIAVAPDKSRPTSASRFPGKDEKALETHAIPYRERTCVSFR